MKWEYAILTLSTYDGWAIKVSKLDAYGYEGWELVFIFHNPTSNVLEYHFKRQVEGIAYA